MLFQRPLFTSHLQFWFCTNPGLALTSHCSSIPRSQNYLDLRSIDECLWAVKSLMQPPVMIKSKLLHTLNPSYLLLSTLTTFTSTLMNEDVWHKTHTNTSSNNFNTLVMKQLVPLPTASDLTSTTQSKNLFGSFNQIANVDYCASTVGGNVFFTTFLVLNHSTTRMLLMLFQTPSKHSVQTKSSAGLAVMHSLPTNY